MPRALGRIVRYPYRTWAAVRRHPLVTLLLATVLVIGVGVGGVWGYAVYQWRSALASLQEDKPEDAREQLQFCLRVWPEDPDVHFTVARVARLTGDLGEAENHLNRCLELQGATERVQLEFLLLRVQGGELDELAPDLIQAADDGHPDSPMILETLAGSYMARLRYRPAYACLSKWIEIEPEDPEPYMRRGWVLERMNKHESAFQDYERTLELDPDEIPTRLRVVEMLLEDKQVLEAEPHLKILRQQVPDDPRVRSRLGMCRFLQGRPDEARPLLEGAVPHLKNDPVLLVFLAKLELQEGRGKEAEAWLRMILDEDPSDTEALYVLSSALQLQERTEEAAATLAEYERKRELVDTAHDLLQKVADNPAAGPDEFAQIGESLLAIGRERLGLYWLHRALEFDPNHQAAHRALVAHHESKGNHTSAEAHRRRLREPLDSPAGGTAEGGS